MDFHAIGGCDGAVELSLDGDSTNEDFGVHPAFRTQNERTFRANLSLNHTIHSETMGEGYLTHDFHSLTKEAEDFLWSRFLEIHGLPSTLSALLAVRRL